MPLFIKTSGGFFLAHNASVVGDVTIGELSSFWFQTVARGDVGPIRIGKRVNVQDGTIIHCDEGEPNEIHDGVTIGHGAVVHGLVVGEGSLIGMSATILQRAKIGKECLIAAGAVVPPGLVVPDRMVVMGVPGKIARAVRDEELEHMKWLNDHYVKLAGRHAAGEFKPVQG